MAEAYSPKAPAKVVRLGCEHAFKVLRISSKEPLSLLSLSKERGFRIDSSSSSANGSVHAPEFRSCSSLCFNCSLRFLSKSFSEMSLCSSAWMDRM